MRKVHLRMKEEEKYKRIKRLVEEKGNKKRVAIELNLSIRQINRLCKLYVEKGKSGFVHGNRSKCPINKQDKSISDKIILLYNTKYQGFNIKHFTKFLNNKENIIVKYDYVYKLLKRNEMYSPKIRKKTIRKIKIEEKRKKREFQNIEDKELEKIISHEIALEDAHPRQERPKYFGENIEMDGSIHLWFGEKKACLHLAVDRCKNIIVGGYFDFQETLNGYYKVYHQILVKYGIPAKFTTDNRTVFAYNLLNKDKRTSDKDVLTQFGYACKRLGTEIVTTSVAQGKPLIERCNGTFQDRLVNEFNLYGINNIDDANKYLIETFIPEYNEEFALKYKISDSVFETSPSEKELNYILAILTPRKIDNGNSIKFKNNYYQPYLNNNIKCFMPKTEALVINAFDGTLLVSIDDQVMELKQVLSHKLVSDFDIENVTVKKEKKVYIPPSTHPWRVNIFKDHCEKSHHKRIYT